jgi:hypothetical protein
MKCSYCRKDIDLNHNVKLNTNYFCNNLCKYNYQKDNASQEDSDVAKIQQKIPEDLKFQIEFSNFKFNKLVVQGSHYGYPKLFINDKKVKPYRGRVFGRQRKYKVKDDDGNITDIILRVRFLDAIPLLKINGNKIEIIHSLKWYEYTWIAIPSVLLFMGGAIGGFLGFTGVYTNSIIFRKFNSKIAKYLLTGVNTFMAYFLFFKILFFIWPIIEEINFNYLQFPEAELNQLNDTDKTTFKTLTDNGWFFKGVYNGEGANITDPNAVVRDSKRYFYKAGKFSQVFYDGSVLNGTWQFTNNFDSVHVETPNENVTLKIMELSKNEFTLSIPNAMVVHVPYKFSVLDYIENILF